MTDNYYGNSQYGAPPSGGSQYYPQPPRDEYSESRGAGDRHSSQNYLPRGPEYSTYQPPREEQYRRSPVPPNMQVTQYQDEYSDYGRRPSGHHRPSDGGLYPGPPSAYSDRPSSAGSRGKEKKNHDKEKTLGAALLGGALGAWAGHEVGGRDHNKLGAIVGAVAGAYGARELEKKREEKRDKKQLERMGSEYGSYEKGYADDYPREKSRSRSRRRSSSRKSRDYSSDSDDGDDQRRRRSSKHRDY